MSERKTFVIKSSTPEEPQVAINDTFINTFASDDIYNDYMKKMKDGSKFWINDWLVISIDNNTHKINFVEYYPIEFSAIKYKNYELLDESLDNDMAHLLKYSYCFHNDYDTYFFPRINVVIWTNKDSSKPAYSVAIYAYGYYDDTYEDNKIRKLINCDNSIKNGVTIKYDF